MVLFGIKDVAHPNTCRTRETRERGEMSLVIGGFGGGAGAVHSDVGDAVKFEMVKVVVRRRCYLGDDEAVVFPSPVAPFSLDRVRVSL